MIAEHHHHLFAQYAQMNNKICNVPDRKAKTDVTPAILSHASVTWRVARLFHGRVTLFPNSAVLYSLRLFDRILNRDWSVAVVFLFLL